MLGYLRYLQDLRVAQHTTSPSDVAFVQPKPLSQLPAALRALKQRQHDPGPRDGA